MPMRAPYICGCGYTIASGQPCPCRQKQAQAREQARPSARERGYTSKWDTEAKAYLASHPVCVSCGAPSSAVDHAVAHKGDKRLFWSRSNWQALCRPCNSRKAAKTEGGFGNRPKAGGGSEFRATSVRTVRPPTLDIPEN